MKKLHTPPDITSDHERAVEALSATVDELSAAVEASRLALDSARLALTEVRALPTARALPPVFYTVSEAAERLRLGRSITYQLVKQGTLRSARVGTKTLIPVAALDDYVTHLLEQPLTGTHG